MQNTQTERNLREPANEWKPRKPEVRRTPKGQALNQHAMLTPDLKYDVWKERKGSLHQSWLTNRGGVNMSCRCHASYVTRTNYIQDPVTRKRQREKLSLCEYQSGGNLIKAAEVRNDERILLQTRGKDVVAIEVRYHRSCYKSYTRLLSKTGTCQEHARDYYGAAFGKFCETVIEGRIIKNNEILRFTKLASMFVDIIQDTKKLDTKPSVSFSYLKKKLQLKYPLLQFLKQSRRDKSEIVLVNSSKSTLGDEWSSASSSASTSNNNDYSDRSEGGCSPIPELPEQTVENLYMTGQYIRMLISETQGLQNIWPPTACDLNIQSAERFVPPQLYNLLAWITNASSDIPISSSDFVCCSKEIHLKLLSLCQDILYLASRGCKPTPKHFGFGSDHKALDRFLSVDPATKWVWSLCLI
ncbi:uncharacterized protein LOC118564555 [Fundulus heteroclitus]|uniref:uncharacterized protein LOC118564555 n=1 Tax=Fundulus heteroclitus TaxID=8078 RepID=UPI00165CA820|nr:uncharacterized protein LOC118564555 [Fundulus heteroclitus]